ncbi:LacI family DNA-binding transcriptional regulator [Pseudoroseicyclus tamaricis]|uniref:Substrate-binding domain-containing protein n=1 Tax=Pseudoroseicyclus tamaricis TaxID=2705421 RepID=A0A6B2JFL7_9RHOB|nr:LacI family DNA-binding transcriptional regulator [Pseudoroseicyclus tamaricis]NDU99850.1 substrate-binding domain-containing protein [Pseudoroseicyclus tamaricis]
MGRGRTTMADVAKRAGVSSATVSMILSGRPDTRFSQETHQRVHEAAAALSYRPNVAARALRTDRSHAIAFISDHVATTRFANGLIRGALRASASEGQTLMVMETGGEPGREARTIDAALDRQVDGIIIASMRAREITLSKTPPGIPMVVLNGTSRQCPASVLPDEERGGRDAVARLDAAGLLGSVALVGHEAAAEEGLFRSLPIQRRLDGIRSGMEARGATFARELSIWEWEPSNGYAAAMELLQGADRPRALLCLNDRLAFGAYQACMELGLRIPEEVSLMSFDNDELAAYLRPGLTTIALPHDEMGARAVARVVRPEEGEELVTMPLIERGSIRAAR